METLKSTLSLTTLSVPEGQLKVDVLPSGDIHRIRAIMQTTPWLLEYQINLQLGNLIDGQTANLYLRKKSAKGIEYARLIGAHSPSSFKVEGPTILYQGQALGVRYQVVFSLFARGWVYDVLLMENGSSDSYDIIYGQDVGLAHPGGIAANEAYTCQYIDHQVFKGDRGYAVLSRQNQGDPLYLQLGANQPIASYSTDGFQFYGVSYKETFIPEALLKPSLENRNLQYEFAYIALATETFALKQSYFVRFYGLTELHPTAMIRQLLPLTGLPAEQKSWLTNQTLKQVVYKIEPKEVLSGRDFSIKDIASMYPVRIQEEWIQDQLVSFFTEDQRHIVLKAKELLVQRPHGNILLSGDIEHVGDDVYATTHYMFGLFQSHITLGNANFHKLLGDSRNALNVQTLSGQRIYVLLNGQYRLLGVPSLFEMGFNYSKWLYFLGDDILEVRVAVTREGLSSHLRFESKKGVKYDVIVAAQITMNEAEYRHDVQYERYDQSVVFYGTSNPMIKDHYPTLKYRIISTQAFELGDERDFLLTADANHGLLTWRYRGASLIEQTIEGTFKKSFGKVERYDHKKSVEVYDAFARSFTSFRIAHPNKTIEKELKKMELIAPWYTMNALVHYATPHGLEQFNGAAWGTRDVCQGPIELFMAAQRYDLVREILLKVFSREFVDHGDFPQWFMFDRYFRIQAHESHGDVIVWPLRSLAMYLHETNDLSILDEKVTYFDKKPNQFVDKTYSIRHHLQTLLAGIQASFIPGTSLPRYGGGDWDDTLQPANRTLTEKMVSGWTVGLLYEALKTILPFEPLETKAQNASLRAMADAMKKDYETYLIKDGVPTGFVIFESLKNRKYLLHPSDESTGLKYRLLPFNRGFISELFPKDRIKPYLEIIQKHLKHPDGVRLMNTAVTYRGGQKTYFQRAETASNFGREIGIQYVHAHIRFIEAMAKIGNAQEAYWGLFAINPINLTDVVSLALPRQSNVYFSSSDAAFYDRYEAKDRFEDVRLGKIPVKAGWRLYSSGPGIYLHQWISHILGVRSLKGTWVLDPVLPHHLSGLKVQFYNPKLPEQIEYVRDPKVLPTTPANGYRNQAVSKGLSKKSFLVYF